MADMDSLEAQVTEEVRRIIAVVSELSALPSRWSGAVELVPDANFRGKKRFSCDIQIDAALAAQPQRWFTLIHESLHTVSVGYVGSDYREYPGWEEGVVEKMQRLLCPTILAELGVTLEPAIAEDREHEHRYNPYIRVLEILR